MNKNTYNENTQVLGIVCPVPAGDWDADKTYQKLNIVRNLGASFIARKENKGSVPSTVVPSENWQLLCKDGKDGQSGSSGEPYPYLFELQSASGTNLSDVVSFLQSNGASWENICFLYNGSVFHFSSKTSESMIVYMSDVSLAESNDVITTIGQMECTLQVTYNGDAEIQNITSIGYTVSSSNGTVNSAPKKYHHVISLMENTYLHIISNRESSYETMSEIWNAEQGTPPTMTIPDGASWVTGIDGTGSEGAVWSSSALTFVMQEVTDRTYELYVYRIDAQQTISAMAGNLDDGITDEVSEVTAD